MSCKSAHFCPKWFDLWEKSDAFVPHPCRLMPDESCAKKLFLDLHTFTHVTNSDIINTGIGNEFSPMNDALPEHDSY